MRGLSAKAHRDGLRIFFRQSKPALYEDDPITADHMRDQTVDQLLSQNIPGQWLRLLDRGKALSIRLRVAMPTEVSTIRCQVRRFQEVESDVWALPADRRNGAMRRLRDCQAHLPAAALEIMAPQTTR